MLGRTQNKANWKRKNSMAKEYGDGEKTKGVSWQIKTQQYWY